MLGTGGFDFCSALEAMLWLLPLLHLVSAQHATRQFEAIAGAKVTNAARTEFPG